MDIYFFILIYIYLKEKEKQNKTKTYQSFSLPLILQTSSILNIRKLINRITIAYSSGGKTSQILLIKVTFVGSRAACTLGLPRLTLASVIIIVDERIAEAPRSRRVAIGKLDAFGVRCARGTVYLALKASTRQLIEIIAPIAFTSTTRCIAC